ncbi:PD-(D/E)XK nuclease family transposase, partial [Natronospora cellulosivora (SeqCode)]
MLDPKVDFVFKQIFGSENNTDILIAFLNSVFKTKGTKDEIV